MNTKALTLGFAVLVGIAGSQPARATTLTTYTDQTAFDAITTVATQTFGFLQSTIAIGGAANDYDYDVLNSATNDGVVSPGDILAGLSISATQEEISYLGPDFNSWGNTNYAVLLNLNNAADGLDFTLDPGVTAFSLGVLSFPGVSNPTVSVYDSQSLLLGSFVVPGASSSGAGEFFGVTTDGSDTIGSVVLSPSGGNYTGVDQVQFGQASGTPEPGSILMFALGLAGLGGMVRLRAENRPPYPARFNRARHRARTTHGEVCAFGAGRLSLLRSRISSRSGPAPRGHRPDVALLRGHRSSFGRRGSRLTRRSNGQCLHRYPGLAYVPLSPVKSCTGRSRLFVRRRASDAVVMEPRTRE